MTLKELYSLYYIEQEIEEYKLKLIELREMAESISPTYTGMPRGGGVSDKVGNGATAIVAYTEMLDKAIESRLEQSMKINEFILSVDDAQLRQIMYLRFIKRLSWQAVAMRIGGNNTADSVRKRCTRFIKKAEKENLSVLSVSKIV